MRNQLCMHASVDINQSTHPQLTRIQISNLKSQSQGGGSKHLNEEGIEIENEIETKEKTTNPMAAYLLLLFENSMPHTNRTFIAAANGTRKKRGGRPDEEEKLKVMVMELRGVSNVEGRVPLLGPPILVLIL